MTTFDADNTPRPEMQDTARPEAEDTARPEAEDTARPEAEDTARPEMQDTARPEMQDMARPESQDTERPQPGGATGEDARVPLLGADELQVVVTRWREIQAEFVDQPKRAMQDADALVSELMERLTRSFAEEHDRLESRWSEEETISTEDLRQGLQRYRSFFERLLAA